jgi:hypothetical protein
MSNHVSFLLEAEAAKRRLAQLFQSEQLGRANHRSTTPEKLYGGPESLFPCPPIVANSEIS